MALDDDDSFVPFCIFDKHLSDVLGEFFLFMKHNEGGRYEDEATTMKLMQQFHDARGELMAYARKIMVSVAMMETYTITNVLFLNLPVDLQSGRDSVFKELFDKYGIITVDVETASETMGTKNFFIAPSKEVFDKAIPLIVEHKKEFQPS